ERRGAAGGRHRRQRQGGSRHGARVTGPRLRRAECRSRPAAGAAGPLPARRPDATRAGLRSPGGGVRRRPPRGDPLVGDPHRGSHLPREPRQHLQRLQRGERPGPAPDRLGVERDDARPAVRQSAAILRPDRRGAPAHRQLQLCAVEGADGGDGAADGALERHPDRGTALLQHHGDRALPDLPHLLGQPARPQVEPLGLCGRARRGAELPPRPGSADRGRGVVHHRRRRHRDAAPQPRSAGRGLPRSAPPRRDQRARDAAGDRQGARIARLRPGPLVARSRRRTL
ncbi:MAG: UDP-glucose 4-epimerase, partial [uncultured Thermomicrobiales bacterium]